MRDDNAKDTLTGSEGQDWFFANLLADGRDYVLDKITDLSTFEQLYAQDLDLSWFRSASSRSLPLRRSSCAVMPHKLWKRRQVRQMIAVSESG